MQGNRWGWGGLAGLLVAAAGVAQDAAAPEAVPDTFRSFTALDARFEPGNVRNRQGKMHCLVCENGLNPVVAVFARSVPDGPDAPLGKLIQALGRPAGEKDKGGFVAKHRAARAGAFAQFLLLAKPYPADDRAVDDTAVNGLVRDVEAKKLRELGEKLAAPGVPFGLAERDGPQVDAWKLDPNADVTVVVYNRMRVAQTWKFDAANPLTDEKIAEVVAAAEKQAKGGL